MIRLLALVGLAGGVLVALRGREILEAGEMFVSTTRLPRGIRNNNPLNIRENHQVDFDWVGERSVDSDLSFEEFEAPEFGFRAAAKIIASYRRRGVVKLKDIIARWAPAEDNNNVAAYVNSVAKNTGFSPEKEIQTSDLVDLFAAMTLHENGQQPYDKQTIARGVALA